MSAVSSTAAPISFEQAFVAANAPASAAASQSKDLIPVEADKVKQKWDDLFATRNNKMNCITRENLAHSKAKQHIEQTQRNILKGASHLDAGESMVVVIGAQYFRKQSQLVEPLVKLVRVCKQLILVDHDLLTLNALKRTINNPKVVIKQVDLSQGIYAEILKLGPALESQEKHGKDLFAKGYEKATNGDRLLQTFENIPKLADEILGKGLKADYVVSSLVASELGAGIIRTSDFVAQNLFGVKRSAELLMDKDKATGIGNVIDTNLSKLCPSLSMAHMDLVLSLAKPLTGRVYFADTTRTLRNDSAPYMKEVTVYDDTIIPLIKKLPCDKQTASWNWDYGSVVYRVDSWIFEKIPAHCRLQTFMFGMPQLIIDREPKQIKALAEPQRVSLGVWACQYLQSMWKNWSDSFE